MSAKKVFIHGVPDCPKIWGPLIQELGLSESDYITPTLPGFESAPPPGFDRTKDSYVEFLVREIEAVVAESGPVDLVGHDWGALLTLRIAGLRPELIRTWAVANGAYSADGNGHRAARLWNIPVIGELVMVITTPRQLRRTLANARMPRDMVDISVDLWRRGHIKKSIIGLYRSANGLNWHGPWVDSLETLPRQGLVFWGAEDPFGPVELGRSWAEGYDFPFTPIEDAGHWVIAENPKAIAPHLVAHWQSPDSAGA